MILEQGAFVLISIFSVFTLMMMIHAHDIMHSAIFLGLFFTATSFMFGLMGASLLGIIQFLVFVGGIVVLIIIAVMLGGGEVKNEPVNKKALVFSLLFFLGLMTYINDHIMSNINLSSAVKSFTLVEISTAFSQYGFLTIISAMMLLSSLIAAIYLLKGAGE